MKAPYGTPRSHERFVERRLRRLEGRRLLAHAVEDGVRFELAAAVHRQPAGLAPEPLMPQTHHHPLTNRAPLRRVVGLQPEEVLVAPGLVQHQGGRPGYV